MDQPRPDSDGPTAGQALDAALSRLATRDELRGTETRLRDEIRASEGRTRDFVREEIAASETRTKAYVRDLMDAQTVRLADELRSILGHPVQARPRRPAE